MKQIFFFLFLISLSGFGQEKELPAYISVIEKGDSIFLTSKNTFKFPVHITLKAVHKNIEVVRLLLPNDSILINTFHKSDKSIILNSSKLSINRYYGNPFLKKYDTLYPYLPPFKRGHRYKVIQGYNGRYTHRNLDSKYALDFQMPVGDTVCAARKGIVINVVKKHTKGGKSKKFKPYANFIMVYHEDGTIAQYVHLKHEGALVEIGDTVEQGQAIGLSGNTGWSTEPHLHFSIYKIRKGKLVSIPSMFGKVSGAKLKKGKRIDY